MVRVAAFVSEGQERIGLELTGKRKNLVVCPVENQVEALIRKLVRFALAIAKKAHPLDSYGA